MSKKIKKHITSLNYAKRRLLDLSDVRSGVFLCSFTTVINTIVGIVSVSISIVFFVVIGYSECF